MERKHRVSFKLGAFCALILLVLMGAGIAEAGPRYAYVANNWDNSVTYIDIGTQTVVGTASGPRLGPVPTGVAVDPTGTWVWVTNQFSNTVAVLSASAPTVITSFVVGANPVGVDFNPKGGFA